MKKKLVPLFVAAVLCLSAGTAYAAGQSDATVSSPAGDFSNNSADTEVTVKVDTSVIKADIPLKMTVVAKTMGGECFVPLSGYEIRNYSRIGIKVSSLALAEKQNSMTELTYVDSIAGTLAEDTISMTLDGTQLTKAAALTDPFTIPAATINTGTGALVAGVKALPVYAKSGPLSFTADQTDTIKLTYTIAPQ